MLFDKDNFMIIRLTGILLKNKSILLIKQNVENSRAWSLPGGKVEEFESLKQSLIREMKEETGLDINVDKLLYVCDHIYRKKTILHITFLVNYAGGNVGDIKQGLDNNKIVKVEFVPILNLTKIGFSKKFQDIVLSNFPNSGNYMGPKSSIGL